MAKFEKGNKAGKGRPRGAKNKNCMNPVFWFNLLDDCLQEFAPDRKIEHVFKALDLLMPKVANVPSTPEESAENAVAAQNLLKALESDAERSPETTGR